MVKHIKLELYSVDILDIDQKLNLLIIATFNMPYVNRIKCSRTKYYFAILSIAFVHAPLAFMAIYCQFYFIKAFWKYSFSFFKSKQYFLHEIYSFIHFKDPNELVTM
jgi:hypothetical protein